MKTLQRPSCRQHGSKKVRSDPRELLSKLFFWFRLSEKGAMTRRSGAACERISVALGSPSPPLFDHDTRGGEPLDCGIVKAVLAQHFVRVLREFGWCRLETGGRP